MNERIRKLLHDAGFDPASIERMGVMPNAEKFAELIVRECAMMAEYPNDKTILEHFGVE